LRILYEDCDPDKALDRSLPYTAYLIEYKKDGESHYDVALGKKQVEIFDHYWDKYRDDFVTMKQSEGRINPKLWGNEPPKTKSRK
jgi:hypothetical protein